MTVRRLLPLVLGPVFFLGVVALPAPGGLAEPAWRVAGLAAWMATWWLTAVIPLEATALLPIPALSLTGIASVGEVTPSYADPIIFLFLGGFLLAATLERWDLHKRFALGTVRRVGTDAPRVVLAFMLASAFASMWISNTATTVMMLPIAAAVAAGGAAKNQSASTAAPAAPAAVKAPRGAFSTALMLSVAYGASIGGVSTLIGTPPNAIFAGAAGDLLGREISFGSWLPIGLSVCVPMLVVCWWWLVRLFRVQGPVPGLAAAMAREEERLLPLAGGERFVLTVFGLTAAAWILREPKALGAARIPGLSDVLPGISDPAIAMVATLILFTVPLPRARFRTALNWETAQRIPWGILLLFGGGLALAGAFESSGLTEWIGGRLAGLRGVSVWLVLGVTAALFVGLTELTSNTATAALGMPLMVGVAGGLGMDALPLMAAAALAASMAFMLPVATPPNAIIFGSGAITPGQMARAGLGLNIVAVIIITLLVHVWMA